MATVYGWRYKWLELRHKVKETILSLMIASKSKSTGKPNTKEPLYVAMVDGKAYHGGMCDRFKGIVSLYAFCKHKNIPFKIRYTYPFKLEDYLSPSEYDWTLKDSEYTDNPKYVRILYMRGEYLITRLLNLKTKRQVHFYNNRDLVETINDYFSKITGEKERIDQEFDWGKLYRELFKPGPILEERINSIKKNIGNDYYAAVFRFQNLLGDFKEYHYRSISNKEKAEELIIKCLDAVKKLKEEHKDKPLLVTSDSVTFLERVSKINGVHIIPGKLVHIDGNKKEIKEDKYEIFMKSFIDFYMLIEAKKIYRIGTKYMYPSQFPLYAAKVHNIPFESINI